MISGDPAASDGPAAPDDPAVPDTPVATPAERHAVLVAGTRAAGSYGTREDPEDAADVRAMPLVLHIPKVDPPSRTDLLEAAAVATLTLCLDERVGAGGPWHEEFLAWTGVRIRKVSRRARGAQWTAAQDVPGVTAEVRGAQARAFVPGRVGDLDPRLRKLQVGGTDLPADDPGPLGSAPVTLWVNRSLDMTVGKTAAQVGHAVMLVAGALSLDAVEAWRATGFAVSVRDADEMRWRTEVAAVRAGTAIGVRDAGYTEVAPGSLTVIGSVGGQT